MILNDLSLELGSNLVDLCSQLSILAPKVGPSHQLLHELDSMPKHHSHVQHDPDDENHDEHVA